MITALLAQQELNVPGALLGLKQIFEKVSLSDAYDMMVNGVEPKLKLKFGVEYPPATPATAAQPISVGRLSGILEFILLGPTVASPLAKSAFQRMLENTNKPELRDKVLTSAIPLRPSS